MLRLGEHSAFVYDTGEGKHKSNYDNAWVYLEVSGEHTFARHTLQIHHRPERLAHGLDIRGFDDFHVPITSVKLTWRAQRIDVHGLGASNWKFA